MTSMKTMMVGVIDAGKTMGTALNNGSSKIEFAGTFFSTYMMQRMMASKTVEFGLVTFGSNKTNNYLNDNQGGYDGVEEVVEMSKPSVDTLEAVRSIKASKVQGDLIDGIVVGQDILIRVNAKKAYNRIMLLVTDGETQVSGVDDLQAIVEQMRTIVNFGLYIAMLGKVDNSSSIIKRENAKLLKSIAENANGRYMEVNDLGQSFHLLSQGAGLGSKPQLSKTSLEISPGVKIPCVCWSKVMKANVPSLKKQPKGGEGGGGDDEDDDGGKAAIKRDTTYRNPEDPDQILEDDEKVKGYKYGGQYVPITSEEEAMFKIMGPLGIKLLGFLPANKIPRHHFLESPNILQGPAGEETSQITIGSLSRALRQTGQVALVRFVKRENSDPYLAALVPPDNEHPDTLLVHRVPCAEDVREYAFPSLITYADSKQVKAQAKLSNQKAAISKFVDAHTLQQVPTHVLTPFNPILHNVYTEIFRRTLNISPDKVIHADDPLKYVVTDPACANADRGVKDAFELVKQVKTAGTKRKVFWSDIDLQTNGNGNAAALNNTQRMELNLATLTGETQQTQQMQTNNSNNAEPLPVFTVGSVTPIEDFQALVAAAANEINAVDIIREAIKTMISVIERNITVGASNAHYKRALTCIQALRATAVAEGESQSFNNFMRDVIKAKYYAGRHKMVWSYVVDEHITLISKNEDSTSDVTGNEANNFLTEVKVVDNNAAPVPVDNDDDDLFGNMA